MSILYLPLYIRVAHNGPYLVYKACTLVNAASWPIVGTHLYTTSQAPRSTLIWQITQEARRGSQPVPIGVGTTQSLKSGGPLWVKSKYILWHLGKGTKLDYKTTSLFYKCRLRSGFGFRVFFNMVRNQKYIQDQKRLMGNTVSISCSAYGDTSTPKQLSQNPVVNPFPKKLIKPP